MTGYEEWKQLVIRQLEEALGDGTEVSQSVKQKNNGVEKEGIVIRQRDSVVIPVAFLEDLYQRFQEGEAVEACVRKLVEASTERVIAAVKTIPDWEDAKKQIRFALVNAGWNQDWLGEVPHQEFLDLAVVCRLLLARSESAWLSCNVKQDLMDYWGISREEVLEAAWENLMEEEFWMEDIIDATSGRIKELGLDFEDLEEEMAEMYEGMEGMMYVASSRKQQYGAVVLLRNDLLAGFAEKQGCSFYILPSSLHEVILMPDHGSREAEELQKIVKEVNSIMT